METLRVLVQNLVIIVVLAVFLEMLLPNGEMRRYTRMVMGLMIIVAIIQAMNGLTGGGLFKEIEEYAWRSGPDSGQRIDILEKGKEIEAENKLRAVDQYRAGIERQVVGLTTLDGKLIMSGAEVKVQEDPAKKDFGSIKEINLIFSSSGAEQSVQPVETVSVNSGGTPSQTGSAAPAPEFEKAARRAADKVASFYNLSPEQVRTIFK